jgi:hypothetical protein
MTKGKRKALNRRRLRKVLKNVEVPPTKMVGRLCRHGWGDGRPGRIRETGQGG